MSSQLIVTVAFVAMGVSLVAVAVPLILRRVPPNQFYGFRTPKTLSDSAIWYSINRSTGIDMAIAGLAIAIAALVLPRVLAAAYLAPLMLVVVGLRLAIVVGKGLWRLRQI